MYEEELAFLIKEFLITEFLINNLISLLEEVFYPSNIYC